MDGKSAVVAEGVIPVNLFPQVMEPIRLKNEIRAIKKWKDSSGNWIFDFGGNIAGSTTSNGRSAKRKHI